MGALHPGAERKARFYPVQLLHIGWRLLYLGLVVTLGYLLTSNRHFDDPFITYRYASNIAHGAGFVYNAQERILSTTTPLFTLLLASLDPIGVDLPHVAKFISALSLAAGGIFLWHLSTRCETPIAGWLGLLLYPTSWLLLATIGSEMPLYLAFCLGAFSFYSVQEYNRSALFAALATLTRPDGILVPIALGFDYLRHARRSPPWKAVLLYAALALPWFAFAQIYFGSPIPATLFTKYRQGLLEISQPFASRFVDLAVASLDHWHHQLGAALALLGLVFIVRRSRAWAPFFTWMALYFIAYSVSGVSGYLWYYAPLVVGFLASMGLGITALQNGWASLGTRFSASPSWRALSNAPIAALLLIPVLPGHMLDLRTHWLKQGPRFTVYRAAGEWLNSNTPNDASIGTLEAGIIGYYSQRIMIDFAGLLQPDVAAQLARETTYDQAAYWAAEHYRPDYLVLQSGLFPKLENLYVDQHCKLAMQFAGQANGYQDVLDVYACNTGQ